MYQREQQRARDREWVERGLEPLGRGSVSQRLTAWLTGIALPGVIGGVMLGAVGWLVITLPLLALGVVH
jgi:hypothetical protein